MSLLFFLLLILSSHFELLELFTLLEVELFPLLEVELFPLLEELFPLLEHLPLLELSPQLVGLFVGTIVGPVASVVGLADGCQRQEQCEATGNNLERRNQSNG